MISALTPSKIVDTDSQLADGLYEGSEVLQNITDMFAPLMKNFRVFFFWEQEKTNLGTTLAYVSKFPIPAGSNSNLSFANFGPLVDCRRAFGGSDSG